MDYERENEEAMAPVGGTAFQRRERRSTGACVCVCARESYRCSLVSATALPCDELFSDESVEEYCIHDRKFTL